MAASNARGDSLIVNFNYVMGASTCQITILDVAHHLQDKHAYISGGKSPEGWCIMTFPDFTPSGCTGVQLSVDQYSNLVTYLCSIPSVDEMEKGFIAVIDRRKSKWKSVKHLLYCLVTFFPVVLHKVVILKPSSLLEKTIGTVSNGINKDNYHFEVVFCTAVSELHQHLHKTQLTPELGGSIVYDHSDWINQRAAVEKFSSNTVHIGEQLKSFTKKLQDTDFPNTVEATEELISDQENAYKSICEDLEGTLKHGAVLLECFRSSSATGQTIPSFKLPWGKAVHVEAAERLLQQLYETHNNFAEFWLKHEKKLCQCLQLRKFEEEFKTLQGALMSHVDMLAGLAETAESEKAVELLLTELQMIEDSSENDLSRADQLQQCGQDFMDNDHYAVDCIRPKCLELQALCEHYRSLLRARRVTLENTAKLYRAVDAGQKWCERGLDLLTSSLPRSDRPGSPVTSPSDVEEKLADLEDFLMQKTEFESEELLQCDGDGKESLIGLQKRAADVRKKCEARRDSLRRKSQKQHRSTARVSPIRASQLTSPTSPSADAPTSGIHQAMNELLDTELTYVYDLRSILDGYQAALLDPSMLYLTTPQLHASRRVIFGNLEEIWNFHQQFFHSMLERCRDDPSSVGRPFLQQKPMFAMYSIYCQNKPASEALIAELGENHPFFKECQRRLGHKLPLSAYLLKPVQRITKYQLLLNKIRGYVSDYYRRQELQDAHKAMTSMLENVNEVMNAAAIIGFPGELCQQGHLLLQGSFSVQCEGRRAGGLKELLKGAQRHAFLYEHSIILCKKREEELRRVKRATYSFKSLLPMSHLGIRPRVVGGDRRRFSLEVWREQKPEVLVFQATSPEIREKWVEQINELLRRQFQRIKLHAKKITEVQVYPLNKEVLENNNIGPSSPLGPMAALQGIPTEPLIIPVKGGKPSTNSLPYMVPSDNTAHPGRDDVSNSTSSDWSAEDADASSSKSDPVNIWLSMGDYHAASSNELSMQEGHLIDVQLEGYYGWCFGRNLSTRTEGWLPSSYLEFAGPSVQRRSLGSAYSNNSSSSAQSMSTSASTQSVTKENQSQTASSCSVQLENQQFPSCTEV